MSLQHAINTFAQKGGSQWGIARGLGVVRGMLSQYEGLAKPASHTAAESELPTPGMFATSGFSPGTPTRRMPHSELITAAFELGETA